MLLYKHYYQPSMISNSTIITGNTKISLKSNKHFNNAINFIHNDSLSALKNIENKFDFFHIDGYHENDYISNEFNLIRELNNSSDNILRIIFDDQECLNYLQNCIDTNYNIIKKIIPNCKWNNVYFEIQL